MTLDRALYIHGFQLRIAIPLQPILSLKKKYSSSLPGGLTDSLNTIVEFSSCLQLDLTIPIPTGRRKKKVSRKAEYSLRFRSTPNTSRGVT
jgi:hypothetical protein